MTTRQLIPYEQIENRIFTFADIGKFSGAGNTFVPNHGVQQLVINCSTAHWKRRNTMLQFDVQTWNVSIYKFLYSFDFLHEIDFFHKKHFIQSAYYWSPSLSFSTNLNSSAHLKLPSKLQIVFLYKNIFRSKSSSLSVISRVYQMSELP